MSTPLPRNVYFPADWWITLEEIAADLRVSTTEVTEWANRKLMPTPHVGPDGVSRLSRAEFDAWMASLKDSAGSDANMGGGDQ
ncbi:helix-turn-helix domain-containing protein [Thermomonospora curvata]|uniref:Helix-turn-helix domain-containing protein n=1 Tax=Thermomonospora curvata (strain ATCC 19995 / DSM 43183 / JCM 3096 / KCTC 9072 / NBRC 15933 / NCIMB 10081 / Henssen B9) TaxID=471852 RepID=D1AE48_THECD|nr:helix-turn-helix domain-containing protein [Thermomonospora curvata]ACY99474.1 hypothetical protein Tcur_3945 [Thermomonospora curvata DSM 43183]